MKKSKPLLTVSNHHGEEYGQPPNWDGDGENVLMSYFQNQHGEQWVFQFRIDSGEALVWSGEVGWGRSHKVEGGMLTGIPVDPAEATWVLACWIVAQERRLRALGA